MAGDWIKFEHVTPDKPEVFRMAAILQIEPDAVVGKLARFWVWCDQQTIDGNALEITDAFIDRITHHPGFSAALREVSWLQVRSGSLVVPNFDRHNGQSAKARALAAKRKVSQRERDICHGHSVTKTGPEKRREEKSKEPDPSIPPPPPAAAEDSADPRHYAVTSRWGKVYAESFGTTYVAAGRDFSTLKRFLAVCKDDADTILTVAVKAWERTKQDRFAKHCKEAATIHGFCTHYNDVRLELRTPQQAELAGTHAAPAPRIMR